MDFEKAAGTSLGTSKDASMWGPYTVCPSSLSSRPAIDATLSYNIVSPPSSPANSSLPRRETQATTEVRPSAPVFRARHRALTFDESDDEMDDR